MPPISGQSSVPSSVTDLRHVSWTAALPLDLLRATEGSVAQLLRRDIGIVLVSRSRRTMTFWCKAADELVESESNKFVVLPLRTSSSSAPSTPQTVKPNPHPRRAGADAGVLPGAPRYCLAMILTSFGQKRRRQLFLGHGWTLRYRQLCSGSLTAKSH